MRALLVLNPKAKRGERDGETACRELARAGIDCERDPRVRDVDAIVAAGGDGTIVSTIPIALDRNVPLGILPLGTFNDLARTLGIPLDLAEASRTIAQMHARPIDVGSVNGHYFVNESSIGLSARIADRQTPELKRTFGVFGILSTTLQSLRQARSFRAEVRYDGTVERFRTIQLTIANSGRFGGIIERPGAAIDDGWLDLYSIEVRNWVEALRVARKVLARDASPGEGLRTRRSRTFEVRTHSPHHVVADGEPAGWTPATFTIVPRALSVFVPKEIAP